MRNRTYKNLPVQRLRMRRRYCSLALFDGSNPARASGVARGRGSQHWIGTWATAAQPSTPGRPRMFRDQTLRLRRDEDVRRFDLAMSDAFRVRRFQAVGYRNGQIEQFLDL